VKHYLIYGSLALMVAIGLACAEPEATPTPTHTPTSKPTSTPTPGPTPIPTPTLRGLELVSIALREESEAPLAGVYVYRDLAFVGGMSTGYTSRKNVGIRILDLSDPSSPELVGRIPLRSFSYFSRHSHGDALATHIDSDAFQGDIAIVLNGVPDSFSRESYPLPYGIWDVTDPTDPQFLSALQVGQWAPPFEDGNLGDKPNLTKAVAGN